MSNLIERGHEALNCVPEGLESSFVPMLEWFWSNAKSERLSERVPQSMGVPNGEGGFLKHDRQGLGMHNTKSLKFWESLVWEERMEVWPSDDLLFGFARNLEWMRSYWREKNLFLAVTPTLFTTTVWEQEPGLMLYPISRKEKNIKIQKKDVVAWEFYWHDLCVLPFECQHFYENPSSIDYFSQLRWLGDVESKLCPPISFAQATSRFIKHPAEKITNDSCEPIDVLSLIMASVEHGVLWEIHLYQAPCQQDDFKMETHVDVKLTLHSRERIESLFLEKQEKVMEYWCYQGNLLNELFDGRTHQMIDMRKIVEILRNSISKEHWHHIKSLILEEELDKRFASHEAEEINLSDHIKKRL